MKSKLGFSRPPAIAVSARCQMIVSVLNCNQLHHTSHPLPFTLFFINCIIHYVPSTTSYNVFIHKESTTSYIAFTSFYIVFHQLHHTLCSILLNHNQLYHTQHSFPSTVFFINYNIHCIHFFLITISYIIHCIQSTGSYIVFISS